MMWVRWTLPRLRIDQVMKVCLKYCTPIAAVMFLGAVLWTYSLPGGLGLRTKPYLESYQPAVATTVPAAASRAEEKPPAKTTAVMDSRSSRANKRIASGGELSMNPINWHSFFFLLFAVASSAFAIAVVVSTNISDT